MSISKKSLSKKSVSSTVSKTSLSSIDLVIIQTEYLWSMISFLKHSDKLEDEKIFEEMEDKLVEFSDILEEIRRKG
jgi:hypothetical protein